MDRQTKHKTRQCRICGLPLTDPAALRCPRCNAVLLRAVNCSGNCRSCQVNSGCVSAKKAEDV